MNIIHRVIGLLKNYKSILWIFWTWKWDDSKRIEEYKRNESISHVYGYAFCEIYINEMQYEKALIYCEAGLEKKPDNEALLRRQMQLLEILQRIKPSDSSTVPDLLNGMSDNHELDKIHDNIKRYN